MQYLRNAGHLLQGAGPYLLLEILLPGGTLFALLLFLYQRSQRNAARERPPLANVSSEPVFGTLQEALDSLRHVAATAVRESGRESDGMEPLAMAPGY